jgi:hypothetical protein
MFTLECVPDSSWSLLLHWWVLTRILQGRWFDPSSGCSQTFELLRTPNPGKDSSNGFLCQKFPFRRYKCISKIKISKKWNASHPVLQRGYSFYIVPLAKHFLRNYFFKVKWPISHVFYFKKFSKDKISIKTSNIMNEFLNILSKFFNVQLSNFQSTFDKIEFSNFWKKLLIRTKNSLTKDRWRKCNYFWNETFTVTFLCKLKYK